jgi:hypothetical protein
MNKKVANEAVMLGVIGFSVFPFTQNRSLSSIPDLNHISNKSLSLWQATGYFTFACIAICFSLNAFTLRVF